MQVIDITGKKFGRLTAIRRASRPGELKSLTWLFKCDCGTEKEIAGEPVRQGGTRSCGCLRRDMGAWNKGITGSEAHGFKGTGAIPHSWFSNLKYKSETRGIPFDLTIDQLWELYERQGKICAISGLPIGFTNKSESPTNWASLDRKDSSLGYTINNVQWVDRRINFMKQSATFDEFLYLCKTVSNYND